MRREADPLVVVTAQQNYFAIAEHAACASKRRATAERVGRSSVAVPCRCNTMNLK